MFRRLQRHLQGEIFSMLKNIVTLVTDLKFYYTRVHSNKSDVFRSILIILRQLLNIITAYIKLQMGY